MGFLRIPPILLLLLLLILGPAAVNADTDQSDVSALNVLFMSLNSPGQLTGWLSNGGDPCAQPWKGVSCSGSSVTALNLPSLGLTGNLGYQMANMKSLQQLDLSNNNLGGGQQITYNLPPNLHSLNFAGNSFSGNIPYSVSQMFSLEYLNLARNQLQGNLTDMFGSLPKLTTMDLSSNSFQGDLPESFSSLSSMTKLYLQNNQFSGTIDILSDLPLTDLSVANNRFSGWIPDKLKKINNLQTGGNSWSSGPAPPPPPYTPPPGRHIDPGSGSGGSNSPSDHNQGGGSSGIGGGGIAGIIISLLVVSGIIAFFLIRRKSRRSSRQDHLDQDQPFTSFTHDHVSELKSIQTSSVLDTKSVQYAPPLGLKPPPAERHKSFDEVDFSNKPVVHEGNRTSVKATAYSVADLQMATNSFSPDNLVGEGSLGSVYRAQFNGGKVLAVKKLSSSTLPKQSPVDFIDLVSNISRLHHPSLTELVGYCCEHGQYLLVYEFQKNGSLHDILHLSDDYSKPLSWNTRMKIALGSGRALEYLHEVCSPSIIHKNLKSANILLDSDFNPRLSDCGLAGLTPNAEFQGLDHNMGSGYTAPEVSNYGQCTLKSDVYCFGVIMLELLTGRKPFDSTRVRSEQLLVRWATPQLHDIDALDKMVDPALKGLYPAKSLSRFADVIALCVQPEPEFRPPMSEVVQALVRLVQRANMNKRLMGGGSDSTRRSDDPEDYML